MNFNKLIVPLSIAVAASILSSSQVNSLTRRVLVLEQSSKINYDNIKVVDKKSTEERDKINESIVYLDQHCQDQRKDMLDSYDEDMKQHAENIKLYNRNKLLVEKRLTALEKK